MRIFIALTADIDNDGVALENERSRLSWRSLELLPRLAEIIHGHHFPATWFVRADPQLKDYYGSTNYLLKQRESLWREFANHGDEIGWHPHLYALRSDGVYVPERDDEHLIVSLRRAHSDLASDGHTFTSVRIGEAMGSNAIMRTLAELGLRVDSSAIPRRRRDDNERRFDWSTSPNVPYWPSTADYRVPGSPALPILEVPMTAIPVKAPYDPKPLPRYANLAYRPAIFAAALEEWFDQNAIAETVLTLIFHPDELMTGSGDHPLYAFTPDALEANIQILLSLAHRRGIDVVGKTMAEIRRLFCRTGNVDSRKRYSNA
jgi:hypothetical protein